MIKMSKKKWVIVAMVLLLPILVCVILGHCSISSKNEKVEEAWKEVYAGCQDRARLAQQLLTVVRGYPVNDAQAQAIKDVEQNSRLAENFSVDFDELNGQKMSQFVEVQQKLTSSLAELRKLSGGHVVNTKYDSLIAGMDDLYIYNKVKEYNAQASAFNEGLRDFPSNLIRGIFGFTDKPLVDVK